MKPKLIFPMFLLSICLPLKAQTVMVLPGYSHYVNSMGTLHIIGEVRNSTLSNLRFVKVTAVLRNSLGTALASDFTYTCLNNLPAGQKTCFDLMIANPPEGWTSCEFSPVEYWLDGSALPNVTIINSAGTSYSLPWARYEIVGELQNTNQTRLEYIQVVGSLYGNTGIPLSCEYASADSMHLEPLAKSTFGVNYTGLSSYSGVASYLLQVDGIPKNPLTLWNKAYLPLLSRRN
jgi:hypothetical protein